MALKLNMLSYFKYFAVITFLIVATAAFFAGIYFRSFAADKVILAPIELQNIQIADNYTKEVWCKYESYFRELAAKPASEWQKNENFLKLSKINKTIFTASPAFKISFYPTSAEEIFTTNDTELVFFDDAGKRKGLLKAFSGINNSRLVKSIGYSNKPEGLKKGSFIQSFIFLDTKKCDSTEENQTPLKVVMEVYTDITKPWKNLYIFQLIVTIGIITTFILLYLALFITSKKTERIINKQHEEKLNLEKAKITAETQNQQKSMFLANVSHELRTPLNAIIGFSDIIKDEVMGPVGHPQYKEYISDINSSGIHLLSLINDILDYSKAEASKLEVEFIDIDVSKIGLSCLRLIEPRANAAKVTLVSHIPEKHITLSADPKRMKQVILNLLSNSVKFTPEGGQVSLYIEDDVLDNKVTIKVTDTGIGIAAKDISKALAPFGQIDSSLSRKYEGTGLGLPLTKKLCEIMGGTFDLKSEVGLGTTVSLVFQASNNARPHEPDAKF